MNKYIILQNYLLYLCKHCNQRHLFTTPDGKYEISEPVLTSYKSITVPCKCGETIYE